MADHAGKFAPETLENFKALCGQRVVEFLDTRNYPLDVEATQHCHPHPNLKIIGYSHSARDADVRVIPNPTPPIMPTALYHDLDIQAAFPFFWWPLDDPFHNILVSHTPQYSMISYIPF